MTNAPFMLNVDCDMFVNNPNIILDAMCSFLGLNPQDCAFVQFPQIFYNQLKDDPFGNQMVVGFEVSTLIRILAILITVIFCVKIIMLRILHYC